MPDLILTLLFPSNIYQSGTSMRLFFTFTFIMMIMMVMMMMMMMMMIMMMMIMVTVMTTKYFHWPEIPEICDESVTIISFAYCGYEIFPL